MSGSISNNNSSSNSEVPEGCTLFKFYMEKCYVLPLELKNDLIYCQRAMRDFLKVHGLVSHVFKEQADADPVQMQRILDELEAEVYEINAEQQYLILRLNEDLELFYKKLEENNIQTVNELGNEYISSLIVPLIGDPNYKIFPQSVLMRDNEEMLIRKHFLISQDEDAGIEPLKLSELDDNVPLMLVNPTNIETVFGEVKSPTVSDVIDELKPLDGRPETLFKSGGSLPTLSVISQSTLNINLHKKEQQRSLLIQRGSLTSDSQSAVISKPQSPSSTVMKQQVPCADVKPLPKRILSSPPPLAPITKVAPLGTDFEVVAQSRIKLRQALRRARKTKQEPRKFDDDDDLELPRIDRPSEKPPQPVRSVPVKTKTSKLMESSVAVLTPPITGGTITKKSVQYALSKHCKTRHAFGGRRKPITSPQPSGTTAPDRALEATTVAIPPAVTAAGSSGSLGCLDDLHQERELELQRLCTSAAQWRDEPRETRVLPSDYGQEQFLGLFELYTHDMVKKLCQRHSKRKRRTVQNASGVDFHYGQQLAVIDIVRQKKLKDKPEFLLSPKEKRLQAKKVHKPNVVAAVAAALNCKTKSKTPEKLYDPLSNNQTEVNKQKCKKRADNLLMCHGCQAYYHMDCHEDTKVKTKSPAQNQEQMSTRCPQCLRDWTSTVKTKIFS